ncbi:MAG: hypothetical protein AAFQ77_00125 [Myxococcota bacterium]
MGRWGGDVSERADFGGLGNRTRCAESFARCGGPSGRYLLTLSDVDLEEVSSDDAKSWWIRRGSVREPGEESDWHDP